MARSVKTYAPLFHLDAETTLSLQEQIRRRVIAAIAAGIFLPGQKLPSSRKLAKELGVSRNTVFLAYQLLIADGHLEAKRRSGIYAANVIEHPHGKISRVAGHNAKAGESIVQAPRFLQREIALSGSYQCPPDWQKYKFPFIEGRYDKSLFPIHEWREASRLALGVKEVNEWSLDNGEVDDASLIEEIRTKLLPRRGISARPDELLITVGEQQALFLATQLFANQNTKVAVEEPSLPALRQLLKMRKAKLHHQNVDDEGIHIDDRLDDCDLVCVSPSRQRPTGVTLSLDRRKALLEKAQRQDFLILEDDFECEMNYLGGALPALYSLDDSGRVIYVASLSKVLAPGVRLGFMVAPAEVIAQARRLRDITTRRPSPNNQRAAAFFLSLGHYDTMLRRLTAVCEERLIALRDALNHYRPASIAIAPVKGGTTYWVRGPDKLDVSLLVRAAETCGILIEPAKGWFALPDGPKNMFRLGVTSLPVKMIRDGIMHLSRVIKELDSPQQDNAGTANGNWLSHKQLKSRMKGLTLLNSTVYGEPCTIELHKDGRMSGRSGYAGEDQDVGRWWIEGDKWVRQWDSWAFAEALAFHVSFVGDTVLWLDDDGHEVDRAIVSTPKE
ncbi:MAG: PLP-dependent aminotransferase family protein [Sphingorhabdus sp.]